MVVDEKLTDDPHPRFPCEELEELVHVVEKGVNDVEQVGQRKTEEAQVDALSHPVTYLVCGGTVELRDIMGVVVLAAAGLEALVVVRSVGLSNVCIDCLRNC